MILKVGLVHTLALLSPFRFVTASQALCGVGFGVFGSIPPASFVTDEVSGKWLWSAGCEGVTDELAR